MRELKKPVIMYLKNKRTKEFSRQDLLSIFKDKYPPPILTKIISNMIEGWLTRKEIEPKKKKKDTYVVMKNFFCNTDKNKQLLCKLISSLLYR